MSKVETKQCTRCDKVLPATDYHTIYTKRKDGSTRAYTYKYCKYCHYKATKPIRAQWVKDNPERINQLQYRATLKWLKKLKGGVYLIQTDKGLYVGASEHVKWRISQHRHANNFSVTKTKNAKILSWVMLEEIEDRELRMLREKVWIKLLQPELNVRNK